MLKSIKSLSLKLSHVFLVSVFAAILAACQSNSDDDIKEEVEDVAEEVKDAAEDVGDKVEDAADDAANEIEDLCEEAKEKAEAENTNC